MHSARRSAIVSAAGYTYGRRNDSLVVSLFAPSIRSTNPSLLYYHIPYLCHINFY